MTDKTLENSLTHRRGPEKGEVFTPAHSQSRNEAGLRSEEFRLHPTHFTSPLVTENEARAKDTNRNVKPVPNNNGHETDSRIPAVIEVAKHMKAAREKAPEGK